MQEKIGNVVLNLDFYSREDLQGEGIREEELLEIAKNYKEEEWNKVIQERNSWPVLFHFSHLRENILEWMPIKKTDKVLEIGSGCGAITGVLARKAGEVLCIESSKMRSMVNAYRNQEHSHVKIMAGDFRNIEKNLEEKFDYITLIGVFAYAGQYAETKDPYPELLRRLCGHLAPGGKIVIAIENRLGMKYWAGCMEDHTGRYFEGLMGYPDTDGGKTFSRTELLQVIQKAGNFKTQFYYPFPDYRFPLAIYSDRHLPKKGELKGNFSNFDRARIQLFDEAKVYDTLIESGMFPEFSNSFLVLAEKEGE